MSGGRGQALVVYALLVPLGLVFGYLVATGSGSSADLTSWGPIVAVLGIICLPLLFKWHQAFLLLTLNSTALIFFLPGLLPIWFASTAISLTLGVATRAMDREMQFIRVPSIIWPLLYLAFVVFLTAHFTGGFGVKVFGSGTAGGKRYLFIFAAIATFFALIARPVPSGKAMLYIGLFFLGSLGNLMSNVIPYLPKESYWLAGIFPVTFNDLGFLAFQGPTSEGIARFSGLSTACSGVFCYLLAKYGIRDMLSGFKFWRFILLSAVLVLSMVGGFRSTLILLAMIFCFTFYYEGLLRTRYAAAFLGMLILGLALVVPFSTKLPLSIQRSLSILPVKVDPVVRYEAEGSSEWRLDMWKLLLPEVPRYLFTPKGMGMDAFDLELTTELVHRGLARSQDLAMLAGDYHNGPLSVLIPFGIWGFIGWLWFVGACFRALWLNHRYGPQALKRINTLLLGYFVAITVEFFIIFGGFYSELVLFTSVIGLSISLNNGICKRPVPVKVEEPEPAAIGSASMLPRSA